MHMTDYFYGYGPFWGMHLFWWAFWIFAIVMIFGFNVPERARVNSQSPLAILSRRFAKGEISEADYLRIRDELRSDEQAAKNKIEAESAHITVAGHPMVDGLSFSATWAVFYSLCALLYWIAPGAILTATSKLFHGLNFTQMAQVGDAFTLGDFVSVLTLGAVYTFFAGIFWSLIHSYFLRRKVEKNLDLAEKRRVQKRQLSAQAR